jgi:GPH family glycoside/pentoside/hexuronide:cation symporter
MTPTTGNGLLRARFAFGVGGFGVSLVYASMGVLLLYFYTHVYGLTPAQAGTTIFVAALCDAVLDPLVGWIVSRTDTRFGRYRPFLIFGSIPMSLAFVAIFVVPPAEPEWRMVLAVCSLATFRGMFQFIYMPYSAMIARLSKDSDERAYIEGWRAWFTSAGSLLISFGGLSLALYFGDGDPHRGFVALAILIGVLSAISFMTCGCLSREIDQGHAQPDVSSPREVIRLLRHNRPFWVVVGASFATQVAYAMLLHASVLYFGKSEGHPEYARWTLAAMTSAGLVASFAWPRVSARHGKRFAWMAGSILAAAALGAMYLLQPHSLLVYAAFFFLVGCGFQAGFIMMFAATADAIDYGEWKTGRRAEAVSFALLTFVIKASLAIGGGAVGWLFSAAGLGKSEADDAEVVQGMRAVFFIVPAVLFLVSAAIAQRLQIIEAERAIVPADAKARAPHATMKDSGSTS